MESTTPSLWQTIDALASHMPLSRKAVESTLSTRLAERAKDEYIVHLSGRGTGQAGGVKIDRVDLVLDPHGEFTDAAGLSLELSGTCLRLDEVRQRYGALTLVQAPRGLSANETTAFASQQAWGVLMFAFKASNPDCLFRVTLRKSKP